MKRIKEKVLKEVLEQKWISLNGKLPAKKVIEDAINKTLAEVGKVIDEGIAFWSRHGNTLIEPLEELKEELGI